MSMSFRIFFVTVSKREFYVYRYEGTLNDIPNVVVILNYPKEVFRNAKTLRVFICTNTELDMQEIFHIYIKR